MLSGMLFYNLALIHVVKFSALSLFSIAATARSTVADGAARRLDAALRGHLGVGAPAGKVG